MFEEGKENEGDWEMIQIILPPNDDPLSVTPSAAGYSQHYGGEKRSWTGVLKEGNHPKVYVGKGGHASYFDTGYTFPDPHHGNGVVWYSSDFTLEMLYTQKWLKFKGNWGKGEINSDISEIILWDGPPGPVFRHSKPDAGNGFQTPLVYMWVDPIYWSDAI